MKWFNRKALGFDGISTREFCVGKAELRRSDIFIDSRTRNGRELRRSGIARRVGRQRICKPLTVRFDRSDVAPTELGANYRPRRYKDVAPTELGANYRPRCYKDVAPTELGANYLPRRYKDFAPTELFLVKKSSLPTFAKEFLRFSQT